MELNLNGSHLANQPAFPSQFANKITLEDPSTYGDDDDSDDDGSFTPGQHQKMGKKTKGRVKIRMEFIENKLRRYTTFSKRKTGIMKKAYELSTLTGTQVMLLVASETGHVYTFATRKLQPMITSESGKALIQTCLNSPDPPPMAPGQQQVVEQRMNPTGFEETELTYAVSEEEAKHGLSMDSSGGLTSTQLNQAQTIQLSSSSPIQQQQPILYATSVASNNNNNNNSGQIQQATAVLTQSPMGLTKAVTGATTKTTPSSISMQLPTMPPGGFIIQQGQAITIPIQNNTNQTVNSQPQTLYRIPAPQHVLTNIQGQPGTVMQSSADSGLTSSTVNVLSAANPHTASALTPSVLMYQTPQGIVYAQSSLHDKQIFNFQQPATALSVPSQQDTQSGQQIITIPVPVSLAGSPQLFQLATDSSVTDLSQPSMSKKARK